MLTNKTQTQVSISGLTYNNLIQDAYNALKDSDEFKNNFTSFTSNSAERMIIELYAYVANQLATRMDQMGNELFVDTASISGLSRLMKLVGARVDFPSAASVEAEFSTPTSGNAITLSRGIDTSGNELAFSDDSSFYKLNDLNGNTWEVINTSIDNDGEIVYNYTESITYTPSSTTTYTLHEGITRCQSYTINSVNTDIIRLSGSPVIKNSVRIYYKEKQSSSSDAVDWVELEKVDNFFTTEALTATKGIYTERNLGNGTCEIWLKPYSSEGITDLGKELMIMYRIGGGEYGNISVGKINMDTRFEVRVDNDVISKYGMLHIENTTAGVGGKNELTTEEIRNTVLQEVRNTKIAVTEEDYEYLLPKYDSSIRLVKCYGEKNDETAKLSETYGYYTNPLNVWLLILKYNKTLSDAYYDDITGLTNNINDIAFGIFDINPRFNEKYQVNIAMLNQSYTATDSQKGYDDYFDDSDENHIYRFPISSDGVNTLKKGNCKITVTTVPYIEGREGDKKGEAYFSKYETVASEITWASLASLTSASAGDVYLVTDEDNTNTINDRWICTQDFSEAIPAASFANYWKLVEFDYIYNNLISENGTKDTMYIVQDSSDITAYAPVYSYVSEAASASWDKLLEKFPYGSDAITLPNITITFNGEAYLLSASTYSTPQDLCDALNDVISPTTNVVVLKSDISDYNGTIEHSSSYVSTSTSTLVLRLASSETSTDVTVNLSSVSTYVQLVNAINAALETVGLNSTYKAMLLDAGNDCWDLAIVCETTFIYNDKDTEISAHSAFYTDYLNGTETLSLNSERITLDVETATNLRDFISNDAEYFKVDGDNIVLYTDGEDVSFNTSNADFNNIFGITQSGQNFSGKRSLTISYIQNAQGSDSAYLNIDVSNKMDKIPADVVIYINIFGPIASSENAIKLGSYYENIDENLPDVDETIRSLLKRGPIKNLYSTNFINGERDVYGSNYQLKFSTGKIQEQTFNELSSQNSPASVTTVTEGSAPLGSTYGASDFLYMKVDNIDFTTSSVEGVVAEDGYAKIPLISFNNKATSEFANTLVTIFSYQEDEGGETVTKYLLNSAVDSSFHMRLYTSSSAYYSSINFGKTPAGIIYNLFGISNPLVLSKEGQVEAEQINYKYLPITKNLAVGKSIGFNVYNNDTPIFSNTVNVSIGYSLDAFINNLSASAVNNYVVINNNRIVFTSLSNGYKLAVSVVAENAGDENAWKLMFGGAWDSFTSSGSYPTKTFTCELTNSGDYYIEYYIPASSSDTREEGYYFVITNANKFPYGDIYFHMYEDYTNDHIVSGSVENNDVVYTDEYIWNSLMTKKRVMLTEHIYKQPRFVPFDLDITCYVHNAEAFSETDYSKDIARYLRTEYGLYSDNIGEEILPEDIVFNVRSNFDKVFRVDVNYLGYDMSNSNTNQTSLETDFNQKHILASTETAQRLVYTEENGVGKYSLDTVTVHGLNLSIKLVSKRDYN